MTRRALAVPNPPEESTRGGHRLLVDAERLEGPLVPARPVPDEEAGEGALERSVTWSEPPDRVQAIQLSTVPTQRSLVRSASAASSRWAALVAVTLGARHALLTDDEALADRAQVLPADPGAHGFARRRSWTLAGWRCPPRPPSRRRQGWPWRPPAPPRPSARRIELTRPGAGVSGGSSRRCSCSMVALSRTTAADGAGADVDDEDAHLLPVPVCVPPRRRAGLSGAGGSARAVPHEAGGRWPRSLRSSRRKPTAARQRRSARGGPRPLGQPEHDPDGLEGEEGDQGVAMAKRACGCRRAAAMPRGGTRP